MDTDTTTEPPRRGRRVVVLRYVATFAVFLTVLGVLAGIKGWQITTIVAFAEDAERRGPPPDAVAATTLSEEAWEDRLETVGTLSARQRVALTSEVAGEVVRIAFDSGDVVERGDVLVVLDSATDRADLRSAEATAELAELMANRTDELAGRGVVPVEDREQAVADLETTRARVSSLHATLAKKTIRAPFSGRLGIRNVDLGQYIAPGTVLTTLTDAEGTFVDFTIPQDELASVSLGLPVRLSADRITSDVSATIAAIEPDVDRRTRAARIRAVLEGDSEQLRPGMFVDVQVVLPTRRTAIAAPVTAVVHAPYGDSVYVLSELPSDAPGMRETSDGEPIFLARQTFVHTGRTRGDFIEIEGGVEPGARVVTAGAFKLHDGSHVYLSEDVAPRPELEPTPENR